MPNSEEKVSLSKQFIRRQNHGRWFPMPRWWAENLSNTWLQGFLRFFVVIWVLTVAKPKSWGTTSCEISQRELAEKVGMDSDIVSRYLAAAAACEVLKVEKLPGATKSTIAINLEHIFDETYMTAFCAALHYTLGDEKLGQHERRTTSRATNKEFAARVAEYFGKEKARAASVSGK